MEQKKTNTTVRGDAWSNLDVMELNDLPWTPEEQEKRRRFYDEMANGGHYYSDFSDLYPHIRLDFTRQKYPDPEPLLRFLQDHPPSTPSEREAVARFLDGVTKAAEEEADREARAEAAKNWAKRRAARPQKLLRGPSQAYDPNQLTVFGGRHRPGKSFLLEKAFSECSRKGPEASLNRTPTLYRSRASGPRKATKADFWPKASRQVVLSTKKQEPTCAFCGGACGTRHCSRCGEPYCCRTCQKADWACHKPRCISRNGPPGGPPLE